jgi:V/A-type H+-transporting ATPase subunit A
MTSNQTGISPSLVGYSVILGIVGDIVRVQVSEEANGNGAAPCLEDLAVVAAVDGSLSLAQVIGIKRDVVALQVFGGTRTNDGSTGSLTMIGTVSPAGGNFEEPVTQSTLATVKDFLGLSYDRAYKRFYPAVDPLLSWSRYLAQLRPWFDKNVAPDWVDRVLAMQELLRRGNDVAQMMQVTGEEGVSLEDHLVHQKSLFLDMVYLQQDAFDKVDASAALPRQKRTFDLVLDLVNRPYQFSDKSAIRDYFVRLTGLFKNLNYSQEETPEYRELLKKIQELADSVANPKRGQT